MYFACNRYDGNELNLTFVNRLQNNTFLLAKSAVFADIQQVAVVNVWGSLISKFHRLVKLGVAACN